jgi:hypothetical protein
VGTEATKATMTTPMTTTASATKAIVQPTSGLTPRPAPAVPARTTARELLLPTELAVLALRRAVEGLAVGLDLLGGVFAVIASD